MDALITSVLEETYPIETGLLGDELVRDLIRLKGEPNHLSLDGGETFDLAPVYDYMRVAAKVIGQVIKKYDEWKREHSSIKFVFTEGDCTVNINSADPAVKAAIVEQLPRIITIVEARYRSKALE